MKLLADASNYFREIFDVMHGNRAGRIIEEMDGETLRLEVSSALLDQEILDRIP